MGRCRPALGGPAGRPVDPPALRPGTLRPMANPEKPQETTPPIAPLALRLRAKDGKSSPEKGLSHAPGARPLATVFHWRKTNDGSRCDSRLRPLRPQRADRESGGAGKRGTIRVD